MDLRWQHSHSHIHVSSGLIQNFHLMKEVVHKGFGKSYTIFLRKVLVTQCFTSLQIKSRAMLSQLWNQRTMRNHEERSIWGNTFLSSLSCLNWNRNHSRIWMHNRVSTLSVSSLSVLNAFAHQWALIKAEPARADKNLESFHSFGKIWSFAAQLHENAVDVIFGC